MQQHRLIPTFELNLNSSVNITPKTSVELDYRLETGRVAIDPLQVAFTNVNMAPVHQMDISSRHLFSSNLSAFAKLNNILFQKYDIWYGIPAQNFNFMVGIGYTF
jgi:outer membrane cobalamin receptor